jgi:hypothetical protein
MPAPWPAPLGLMDTMAIGGYQPCCNVLRHYSQVKGVCRDLRAGEMSGLRSRVGAATSMLMEGKPGWESGPGIRVVDAEFCGERWIVKAEASGDARCPSCAFRACM